MWTVWLGNETFSHGILILPISMWLVWRERKNLLNLRLSPSLLGLGILFAGMFGWLLGQLADVNVVSQFGAVLVVIGLVPLVFGIEIAKKFWFPLLFLLFMVPAGEFLVPILMLYTADATIWALQFSGIPVFRENMHFTLPTGRWSVVEACSGLRYVIAAMVLACLFSYLNYRTWGKRIAFTFFCLVLAIVSNWVRAYTVVLVGHWSNMKYGTGDDHIYYGWVFFGVVMCTIFWIGSKWRDDSNVSLSSEAHLSDVVVPSADSPIAFASIAKIAIGLTAIIGVASLPGFFRNTNPNRNVELVLKQTFPEFSASTEQAIKPKIDGARSVVRMNNSLGMEIYVAYFAAQTNDAEMINGSNVLIPLEDWQWKVYANNSTALLAPAEASTANVTLLKNTAGQMRNAYTTYCVGGSCSANLYKVKGLTAWSLLTGKGDHSFAVLISAPEVSNEQSNAENKALIILSKVAQSLVPLTK